MKIKGNGFTIVFDLKKIKIFDEKAKKNLLRTAEQLRAEIIMSGTMPFDTGNMQNVQTYIDSKALGRGEIKIVHDVPYARRVYFGYDMNFQTTFNANARAEWWEPYINGTKRTRAAYIYSIFMKKEVS